eukprot:Pgem_evm1s10832
MLVYVRDVDEDEDDDNEDNDNDDIAEKASDLDYAKLWTYTNKSDWVSHFVKSNLKVQSYWRKKRIETPLKTFIETSLKIPEQKQFLERKHSI